jgi:hypothetical protein
MTENTVTAIEAQAMIIRANDDSPLINAEPVNIPTAIMAAVIAAAR